MSMTTRSQARRIRLQGVKESDGTPVPWDRCMAQAHSDMRLADLERFVKTLDGNETIIQIIRHSNLPVLSQKKTDELSSEMMSLRNRGYSTSNAFYKATEKYAYTPAWFDQAEVLQGLYPATLKEYSILFLSGILERLNPFGKPESKPVKVSKVVGINSGRKASPAKSLEDQVGALGALLGI